MYSTATIDNTDDKMIELVKNVYCQPTILEAFTPGNVFWLSKIIETSLPKNIASVLDIGCGTGGVLTFVQGRHPELRKAVGSIVAPDIRLEGREHHRKLLAERRAEESGLNQQYTCRRCAEVFTLSGVRRRAFFCTPCVPLARQERVNLGKWPLICAQCKKGFLGKGRQRRRSEKSLPVVCSPDCRQEFTKTPRFSGLRKLRKISALRIRAPHHNQPTGK